MANWYDKNLTSKERDALKKRAPVFVVKFQPVIDNWVVVANTRIPQYHIEVEFNRDYENDYVMLNSGTLVGPKFFEV